MNIRIAPSLMCMDLTNFKQQIQFFNGVADYLHVDIMDGHFVKNITLSPFIIKNIRKISSVQIDAHLMVEHPEEMINEVASSGADIISLHAETINGQAFRLIDQIHELGCKAGIVLNPETPIEVIKEYADSIAILTIMTVDPGFAGQKFIRESFNRIKRAKQFREMNKCNYKIQVDGSCNEKNFGDLYNAGTNIFVMGSSGLFGIDKDLRKAWERMQINVNKSVSASHSCK